MAEGKQVESALLTEHFRYTPLVSWYPCLKPDAQDLFSLVTVSQIFGCLMFCCLFSSTWPLAVQLVEYTETQL